MLKKCLATLAPGCALANETRFSTSVEIYMQSGDFDAPYKIALIYFGQLFVLGFEFTAKNFSYQRLQY
jgi:hypothetical protein